PHLATHTPGHPFYLLDSQSLIALASSLHDQIVTVYFRSIPTVKPRTEFPYREQHGLACFAAGARQDLSGHANDSCRYCDYPFDLKKLPRVIAHVGSHILYDTKNIDRGLEPCGICLRPYTLCQIYLQARVGGEVISFIPV
ncbi:hypothetical protein BD626DRAFT_435179, partial [Schizophyllum amplum]